MAADRTTYESWYAMKRRCLDVSHMAYMYYGGKGITICDAWLDFNNFVADMGLRPDTSYSLDRIDSNLGYYKENCQWLKKVDNSKKANFRHGKSYTAEYRKEANRKLRKLYPERVKKYKARYKEKLEALRGLGGKNS